MRRAVRPEGNLRKPPLTPAPLPVGTYGMRVTGAEVRNNPLKKVYLCQIIGKG